MTEPIDAIAVNGKFKRSWSKARWGRVAESGAGGELFVEESTGEGGFYFKSRSDAVHKAIGGIFRAEHPANQEQFVGTLR